MFPPVVVWMPVRIFYALHFYMILHLKDRQLAEAADALNALRSEMDGMRTRNEQISAESRRKLVRLVCPSSRDFYSPFSCA